MRRRISAILLSAVIAVWMVPTVSVSAMAVTPADPVPAAGEAAANEVVVLYEDGKVTTDAPATAKEKSAAKNARKAKSFGQAMSAGGASDKADAVNTLGDQALILDKSIKGKYKIKDTVVFEHKKKTKKKEKVVSVIESDSLSTDELVEQLKDTDGVKYAEPNYKAYSLSMNDTLYDTQWSLHGENGMNAEEGWARAEETATTSADDVVVAVVDTGVDYEHPDLRNRMWKAPKNFALKGTYGYDYSDEDADPMDEMGHGTHCAGIIAAEANNSEGISGVAGASDRIKIMAVRVLDADGGGELSGIISGMRYVIKAKELGVNVKAINASLGLTATSEIFDDVMEEVGSADMLAIVAASNDGRNNDDTPVTPANSKSDAVVSVAATDEDGTLASYSNWGIKTVDIAAPGSNIVSTVCYDNYAPYLYTADKLKDTTEYYGEFDASSKTEDGYVPTAGTDINGKAVSGLKQFGAAKLEARKTKGSEGSASLSISTAKDVRFSAGGNDTALRWTIKNAKADDEYILYFPYEKTTADVSNVYASVVARSTVHGTPGVMATGDVIVSKAADGKVSYKMEKSSDGEVPFYSVSEIMNSIWRADSSYSTLFDRKDLPVHSGDASAQTVTDDYGLGLVYHAVADGDAVIDISALALSRDDADVSDFGKYDIMSGTSMATPAVAGAVALMAVMNPEADAQALKQILLQTTNDKFRNEVSSGGALDFDEYSVGDVSTKPVIKTAEVDYPNQTVEFTGSSFGTEPSVSVVFNQKRTETKIAAGDISVDGNTLTIRDNYGLIGSDVTIKVTNNGKTGQAGFYLVSGEPTYDTEFTAGGASSSDDDFDDDDFFDDDDDDDVDVSDIEVTRWISGGSKMYGYDLSGELYTIDDQDIAIIGEDSLRNQIAEYVEAKGQSDEKSMWNLPDGIGTMVSNVGGIAYMNGKIYELVYVDAGDRESYMLVSLDVSQSNPKWKILGDSLIGKGNLGDIADYKTFLGATLTSYKGKLYLLGGASTDEDTGTAQAMNTTYCATLTASDATWSKVADMPADVMLGRAVVNNGKLYYVLGMNDLKTIDYNVYAFDGSSWTVAGKLPKALTESRYVASFFGEMEATGIVCAVGADADGIVFGGASFDGVGDTFRFNTKTGQSEALGYTLFSGISDRDVAGTTAGGKLYAIYTKYKDHGDSSETIYSSIPVSKDYIDVSKSVSGKGKGTITGIGSYHKDDPCTVTITPAKGSYIAKVTFSGSSSYTKSYSKPTSTSQKALSKSFTVSKYTKVSVSFGKISTKVKINKKKLKLGQGKTYTLKAHTDGTVSGVKWKSSKKSLATVSKSGKVKINKRAKRGKKVTIYAISKENAKLKAKCVITIK